MPIPQSRFTACSFDVLIAVGLGTLVLVSLVVYRTVAVLNPPVAHAVVAIPSGLIGVYVGLRHPQLVRNGLGFVLGAVPFAQIPGVPMPLLMWLSLGAILTAIVHTPAVTQVSSVEILMLFLVLVSAMSLWPNLTGAIDLKLFGKWLVATSITFVLLRLSNADLATFGRSFVLGTALGSVVSVAMLAVNSPSFIESILVRFSYPVGAEAARVIVNGTDLTHRLAGVYIDPNAGGVVLYVGIVVCAVVFNGWYASRSHVGDRRRDAVHAQSCGLDIGSDGDCSDAAIPHDAVRNEGVDRGRERRRTAGRDDSSRGAFAFAQQLWS